MITMNVYEHLMMDLGRARRQETPQMRKVLFARQPYDGLQMGIIFSKGLFNFNII